MKWSNVSREATDAGERIVAAIMAGDGQSEEVARLIDGAIRDLDAADLVRGLGNLSDSLATVLALRNYQQPSVFFQEFIQVDLD